MNNREAHYYLEELQRMMTQHRGIFSEEFVCANGMAIQALEKAQEQRWIPVSEGLPNPNEKENDCLVYYLVQNEYGDMMVAAYRGNTNGEIWWEQMYAYKPIKDEVIAWMPLPSSYKEGQE